jgi:TFIIIC subunit triple barrel domain
MIPEHTVATKKKPKTSKPKDTGLDDDQDDVEEEAPSGAAIDTEQDGSEFLNRVQILDLESYNPIISFRNRVFEGQWSSTIGTEMLFTAPGSSEDPPLRQTPDYALQATTSIRLMTKPATLAPHVNVANRKGLLQAQTKGDSKIINVDPFAGPQRKKQATFLQKLQSVKRAKGELDDVTIIAKKAPAGQGWRSEHKLLVEALENSVKEGDQQAIHRLSEMYAPRREPMARPKSGYGSRGGRVRRRELVGKPRSKKGPKGAGALIEDGGVGDSGGGSGKRKYNTVSRETLELDMESRPTPETWTREEGEIRQSHVRFAESEDEETGQALDAANNIESDEDEEGDNGSEDDVEMDYPEP